MAKFGTFKVQIPCDDAVDLAALKERVRETLRAAGDMNMQADPVEGQPALDGTAVAFLGGADVKMFVMREPRPRAPKVKT